MAANHGFHHSEHDIPECLRSLAAKNSVRIRFENEDTFHENLNLQIGIHKQKHNLKKLSSKVGYVNNVKPIRKESTADHDAVDKELDIEKKKETSPLKYCIFIAKYPVLAFLLASTAHVAVIAATVGLIASGSDVFPLDFDSLPLYLHHDSSRKRDLAWRQKYEYNYRIFRPVIDYTYPTWYRGGVKDVVEISFEISHGNIFDSHFMQLMKAAEERLFSLSDYTSNYCQVDQNGDCIKPWSLFRLFDGTYAWVDQVFNDTSLQRIPEIICKASIYNETKEFVELFIQKDIRYCSILMKATKVRFFLFMGNPLRLPLGFSDLENFLMYTLKPEIEHIRDVTLNGKMWVYYISEYMLEYDAKKQALLDMMLCIGSFALIILFMWIQTATFWITFMGIFSILTSFLLTNLIYRYILKYIYFGFFHIVSMFIILGIGADDVFVFYDTWRLTGHTEYPSKAHRLSDCYRKAAKTTFVTSVTTMSAFLVSGLSPLMPVATFGLFSGILVAVNYLFDLLYFPTVIMLYSAKIKPLWDKTCGILFRPCKRKKSKKEKIKTKETVTSPRLSVYQSSEDSLKQLVADSKSASADDASSTSSNCDRTSNENENIDKKNDKSDKDKKHFEDRNRIVLFLKNGFYDFITLRGVRICVPLMFLGVSAYFVYSASTIEPDPNQVQLFVEKNNYGKASRQHYYGFERNFEDEYTTVNLVWGMKEKDMSSCDLKSSDYCTGTMAWDDTFNPNSAEAQTALLNVCNRLHSLSASEIDDYRIKRNAITNELEIGCFMTDLQTFLQTEKSYLVQGTTPYPTNLNLDIPLDAGNMTLFMQTNSHIYDISALPADFEDYLGIAIAYWLSNRYTATTTADYTMYNDLLGEQYVYGTSQRAGNTFFPLYYGNKLKYISIEVNLTMSVYTVGYPEGKPIQEKWEAFMQEELAKMPASMKGGFQSTKNTWHWIKVQETLATSAVEGIIIGLCIACPILILTTMNVVIGILATICIGLITAFVVGIVPLAGWKLGVLESLNLCMVVGLSVDYVVHLAEAYRCSSSTSRMGRVNSMLESMGLSVLSGAITTFGAATFMLFAQIQFIYQFGIFVMSTISISLVFAFLGFTTFMALCGPQGNAGCLITLFKNIKNCCCRKCRKPDKPDLTSDSRCKWFHISCILCNFTSLDEIVVDSFSPLILDYNGSNK